MRNILLLITALILVITPANAQSTRIDILFVFTPAVSAHYGGEDGILAHLISVIEGSNAALENSEIPMVFHMVHAVETNYVESTSIGTDLERLRMVSDGFMDEVHGVRNETGADLVCLIRRGNTSVESGRAEVLNPTAPQQAFGFSVVADSGALSNWTFAHEIGHNLSSRHDRPTTAATLPHAYGHRFVGSDTRQYRTIMATTSGWTRIPFFENPAVSFLGTPTGVPKEATDPADNALTFSISGPRIAAFRAAQSGAPRVRAESPGATVVSSSNASLRPAISGLPPVAFQWYRGMPGDTSQPEIGATSAALDLTAVSGSSTHWISAANAEGSTASRAVRVNVIPAPAGPFAADVSQLSSGSGFQATPSGLTQDFIPSVGYLHELRLGLFRQGSPLPAFVRLTAGGVVIFEGTITGSQVQTFATDVVVPVRSFVNPGELVRIELSSDQMSGTGSGIFWAGNQSLYGTDPAYGESSITNSSRPDWVFRFSTHGKAAAVYHAWLRGKGLRNSEADPLDQPVSSTSNLLRYAAAVEPGQSPQQLSISGSDRRLRFLVRRNMADYNVIAEHSANLTLWKPVIWSSRQQSVFDSATDRIELMLPHDPANDNAFYRLRITPQN